MQRCPKCNRVYAEGTYSFCLDDGALLSAPDDLEETETVIAFKPPMQKPSESALASPFAQKSNKLFLIVGSAAILVFGAALILYFQINGNLSPEEAIKKGIAATANGEPIMLKEVDRAMPQNETEKMSPSQLRTERLKILDTLIDREIVFQRAKKEQLLPTEDEITNVINPMKQQEEIFQKVLKDTGITETDYREFIKKDLAVEKLTKKIFSKVELPKDYEVEAYFKANNKDEKLTLDTPGVRQKTIDELVAQRKQALGAEFLKAEKNAAKIVNYLAASNVY